MFLLLLAAAHVVLLVVLHIITCKISMRMIIN